MRWIVGVAMLAVTASAPAGAQDAELPMWMAGCWETRDGERWTDECWMSPRGGVMLGASRSGTGAELRLWEAMQITLEPAPAREGAVPKMTFWASPNGAARTPFVLEPSTLPGATFVNLANDYPQRIRYWRDGDLLKAEISRVDGSNPMGWTFVPAGGE